MKRATASATSAVLLFATAVAGCAQQAQQLDVLAAASLTDTFTTLATTFEAEHPGVDVRLSFGSSATLAAQVVEGAPADVLATADPTTMDAAGSSVEAPTTFATNVLVMVTRPSLTQVTDLSGLASLDYVTCVSSAPCGAAADRALAAAAVGQQPVSREPDVKATLARVVSGEADAALVYRSDAVGAGKEVRSVELQDAEPNLYPIAQVSGTDNAQWAQDWIALVTGPYGHEVLTQAGFGAP